MKAPAAIFFVPLPPRTSASQGGLVAANLMLWITMQVISFRAVERAQKTRNVIKPRRAAEWPADRRPCSLPQHRGWPMEAPPCVLCITLVFSVFHSHLPPYLQRLSWCNPGKDFATGSFLRFSALGVNLAGRRCGSRTLNLGTCSEGNFFAESHLGSLRQRRVLPSVPSFQKNRELTAHKSAGEPG